MTLKHARIGILMAGTAVLCLSAGATDVSGTLAMDTTWDSTMNPIRLVGNLIVPDALTLTVEPGCVVQALLNTTVNVQGSLVADGTPENPIVFAAETPSAWNGFSLSDCEPDTVFDHCAITGTKTGAITVTNGQLTNPITISNCIIESNSTAVVDINNTNATLTGNVIRVVSGSAVTGIKITVKGLTGLLPVLAGNVVMSNSHLGKGIEVLTDSTPGAAVTSTVAQCRVSGFDVGVGFQSNRTFEVTWGVDQCILTDNNVSVDFRASTSAQPWHGSITNSWLSVISADSDAAQQPAEVIDATTNFWSTDAGGRIDPGEAAVVDISAELGSNPFPTGDVDDDGDTDGDDAKEILEYLAGNILVGDLANAVDADADGDSDIDIRDAALIKAYASNDLWRLPR